MATTGYSVAVIGLGSMGLGMARSLLRAGHRVVGVDVVAERRQALVAAGGAAAATPAEAARGCDAVVAAVVSAAQTEAVLFGEQGAAAGLAQGAVLVSSATVAPRDAVDLAAKADAAGLLYLDAPMSGGAARAEAGELTFMASGSAAAFARAEPALEAMAQKVFRLGERPGQGSAVKLVNQLLAGVHIAAACEAVALGVKMGLDARTLYEVICQSAGSSWMFQNRVPHILDGDYRPRSAVSIFTKDLGIVLDTARAESFPVPLAGCALQQFVMAAAAGMAEDDDASVVRVYQRLSGIELPGAADA